MLITIGSRILLAKNAVYLRPPFLIAHFYDCNLLIRQLKKYMAAGEEQLKDQNQQKELIVVTQRKKIFLVLLRKKTPGFAPKPARKLSTRFYRLLRLNSTF